MPPTIVHTSTGLRCSDQGLSQFLKSVGAYKLMSFQDSYVEMIKEVLVKVYVLKKCLESRYNTWVVDGNMLPVNGDLFIEADTSYDFYIGKSSDLFFAGRSSSARNIGAMILNPNLQ
ncbi:uncharacterized protein Pyn_17598 [Prunus yedoensis var. nudiflora]|uniref:Uncharacterized protein n=1 Tax=Prunus yedoensis var. nudiflora TaxID=2094558 RepID=A0A315A815_PRUYE|nr:uncharacterized protein Pyn_17598 [Prunus yedoensis var. nudiflora]